MDAGQPGIERTLVEDRPDRRLDGVSDDELLFLFSYDADHRRRVEARSTPTDAPEAEARLDTKADTVLDVEEDTRSAGPDVDSEALPASADQPSSVSEDQTPPEPGPQQAILRLGTEPVVVSVRPEPQPPWAPPDDYWPRLADERPAPTDDQPAPAADQPGQVRMEPPPDKARASFELARWMEAVRPDYLGRADKQSHPAAGPAVLQVQPPVVRTSRPSRDKTRKPALTDAPRTDTDPPARPLVMRFADRAGRSDERADAAGDRPGRTTSIGRGRMRRRGPFRWRRMLACAAVSGGMGSAALLVIHWISQ
jgi:hypothetical protein